MKFMEFQKLRSGYFFGYFIEKRTKRDGRTSYIFTSIDNTSSLIKPPTGIVTSPPSAFKLTVTVNRGEDEIEKFMKEKTLVAAEFNKGKVIKIFTLTETNITFEKPPV